MKKNYFYNLLLSIVNILFPIISFPYVSRILGPTAIGKVQLAYSFSQYFGIIAALGIPIYGIQLIAKVRDDKPLLNKVFSELITIYMITSVALFLIYIVFTFSLPYFRANAPLYLSASLTVLLAFSSIDWLYSGLEEFDVIAIRSISIKVISLVLMFLFVKTAADYTLYFYILMFSVLGNNIANILLIGNRVKISFSGLELKRHFSPLLFIFSTVVAASMYTVFDTVLLGSLSDEKTVGLYTAAMKLTKISLPFITSMGIILIPSISNRLGCNDMEGVQKLLNRSFHFICFFAVPIVTGLALLAPEFVSVFSGDQFLGAVMTMRVLSFLVILVGFGHFFCYQTMVPAGMNKQTLLAVCGGVVTSIVLNFLLVPRWHQLGGAIANISAELVVTCLYFYFIRKYYSFSYEWSLLAKALLCSAFFIPVILIVHSYHLHMLASLLISVPVCTGVYAAGQYFLFRDGLLFSMVDFFYLRSRLNKQPK